MDLFMCLLISIVSLPLTFLFSSLLSLAASAIQLQVRANFARRPGSHFLGGGYHVPFGRGAACSGVDPAEQLGGSSGLRVALYESAEPAECVFCLSGIEEGEEIRELRCRHLFHRHCLDRWLEHRRARCPLCRDALVPREDAAAAKCSPDDADDEEFDETFLNYSAYVNSAWWIW